MKSLAYRLRFRHLMYGYGRLLQLGAFVDHSFSRRLSERPFSFVMTSRENTTARYFFCNNGTLRSTVQSGRTDFKLIWRDNRTGGRVMLEMLRGKPKALYNAILNGDLLLEGDARTISWYMETNGRLERIFRPKKETHHE